MSKSRMTPKSKLTRQKILEAAQLLFLQKGYDNATMRQIARQADMAPGSIYHHFPTKEHIAQSFYGRIHEDYAQVCASILKSETKLEHRLRQVVRSKIILAEPLKKVSRVLFRAASDPQNPLSPFSAESAPVRNLERSLFRQLVSGSSAKLPADVEAILADYLWLYQMGVLLYWIHDTSENSHRTFRLIDRTVKLIQTLVELSTLPLVAPFRKKFTKLMHEYLPDWDRRS